MHSLAIKAKEAADREAAAASKAVEAAQAEAAAKAKAAAETEAANEAAAAAEVKAAANAKLAKMKAVAANAEARKAAQLKTRSAPTPVKTVESVAPVASMAPVTAAASATSTRAKALPDSVYRDAAWPVVTKPPQPHANTKPKVVHQKPQVDSNMDKVWASVHARAAQQQEALSHAADVVREAAQKHLEAAKRVSQLPTADLPSTAPHSSPAQAHKAYIAGDGVTRLEKVLQPSNQRVEVVHNVASDVKGISARVAEDVRDHSNEQRTKELRKQLQAAKAKLSALREAGAEAKTDAQKAQRHATEVKQQVRDYKAAAQRAFTMRPFDQPSPTQQFEPQPLHSPVIKREPVSSEKEPVSTHTDTDRPSSLSSNMLTAALKQSTTQLNEQQRISKMAAHYAAEASKDALEREILKAEEKQSEKEVERAAQAAQYATPIYTRAHSALGASTQVLTDIADRSYAAAKRVRKVAQVSEQRAQQRARKKRQAAKRLYRLPAALKDEVLALTTASHRMEELASRPERGFAGSLGATAVQVAARAKKLARLLHIKEGHLTGEGAKLHEEEDVVAALPSVQHSSQASGWVVSHSTVPSSPSHLGAYAAGMAAHAHAVKGSTRKTKAGLTEHQAPMNHPNTMQWHGTAQQRRRSPDRRWPHHSHPNAHVAPHPKQSHSALIERLRKDQHRWATHAEHAAVAGGLSSHSQAVSTSHVDARRAAWDEAASALVGGVGDARVIPQTIPTHSAVSTVPRTDTLSMYAPLSPSALKRLKRLQHADTPRSSQTKSNGARVPATLKDPQQAQVLHTHTEKGATMDTATARVLHMLQLGDSKMLAGGTRHLHQFASRISCYELLTLPMKNRQSAATEAARRVEHIVSTLIAHGIHVAEVRAGRDGRYSLSLPASAGDVQAHRIQKELEALGKARLLDPAEARSLSVLVKAAKEGDTDSWRALQQAQEMLQSVVWTPKQVLAGLKTLRGGHSLRLAHAISQHAPLTIRVVGLFAGHLRTVEATFEVQYHGGHHLTLDAAAYKHSLLRSARLDVSRHRPMEAIQQLWSLAVITQDRHLHNSLSPMLSSDAAALSEVDAGVIMAIHALKEHQIPPYNAIDKEAQWIQALLHTHARSSQFKGHLLQLLGRIRTAYTHYTSTAMYDAAEVKELLYKMHKSLQAVVKLQAQRLVSLLPLEPSLLEAAISPINSITVD